MKKVIIILSYFLLILVFLGCALPSNSSAKRQVNPVSYGRDTLRKEARGSVIYSDSK